MSFSNQVVWITGASSGIGEATAHLLAQKGARLVLSARREGELERVKSSLGVDPTDVLVLPMDVEKPEEFPALVEKVLDTFGRIDLLYNNAGISQRGGVLESDLSVYKRLMEVNFYGVVALTKAVLPIMVKQGSGLIAATSSVSGKLGSAKRSGYSASKHALHGFFDALRAEVHRDGIHITLICPGYIQTEISKNALGPDGQAHGKMDQNQAKGMPVQTCAAKIVRAFEKKSPEVYMGGFEVMGVYLKRFFPAILRRILVNEAPK